MVSPPVPLHPESQNLALVALDVAEVAGAGADLGSNRNRPCTLVIAQGASPVIPGVAVDLAVDLDGVVGGCERLLKSPHLHQRHCTVDAGHRSLTITLPEPVIADLLRPFEVVECRFE